MRALWLLTVGLIAVAASASGALAVQIPAHYGVGIQAVYDQSGDPLLVANFLPNGGLAKPRWSICAPPDASVCKPAPSASQELIPGATKPGTVFKATATYRGTTYAATSAVWQGQVRAVRPPRLSSEARVGARVRAIAARWRGGWRVEPGYHSRRGAQSGGRAHAIDQLRVEACRTRGGAHCLNVSPVTWAGSSKGGAVRVGARFKGWYLFAFDQRFSGDQAFATSGYGSPEDSPTLTVGATVARSRPYGPVA